MIIHGWLALISSIVLCVLLVKRGALTVLEACVLFSLLGTIVNMLIELKGRVPD